MNHRTGELRGDAVAVDRAKRFATCQQIITMGLPFGIGGNRRVPPAPTRRQSHPPAAAVRAGRRDAGAVLLL